MSYDLIDDPTPRAFSKRWDLMYVNEVKLDKNKALEGKSIADIAKEQGKDIFDVFMDLSMEEDLETQFITPLANGDEDAVSQIINYPPSLVSLSDGGAHVQFICDTAYPSYLLGHWVREKKAMSLEKAIKVLAAHPAATLGLKDRGMIRPGMAADLAIFDPDTIHPLESVWKFTLRPKPERKRPAQGARSSRIRCDTAMQGNAGQGAFARATPRTEFSDTLLEAYKVGDLPGNGPRLVQECEGMHYTVVNGDILVKDGKHTGSYPGRVLRGVEGL